MEIKFSGRSSDFITPNFAFGCRFKCAYCYMRNHNPDKLYVKDNPLEIIEAIDKHHKSLSKKVPNQTHSKYWTYDFSCNEDYVLHLKYHNWIPLFEYFRDSNAFGTAATKFVNPKLLEFNPNRKIRIRMSLMPQDYSDILEPNTSKIIDRIRFVNELYNAGYDVHLNFSPVIYVKGESDKYKELFELVNENIDNSIKKHILAEVIFLTHGDKLHKHNLINNPKAENLLWNEELQEYKQNSYGNTRVRYKYQLKSKMINRFKRMHENILPWNKIRYIF